MMKRFLFLLACVLPLAAPAATVTSRLSADETAVGMPVRLEVRVDGTTNVILPRQLELDGFQAQQTGRSTQVQIINGQISTTGVYQYTLMPLEEGEFEIPAIELTVDGRKESTQPHRLTVVQGSLPPPRPAPAQPQPPGARPRQQQRPQDTDSGPMAYAEVIVPKKTVFAGELVPVELRFYFNEGYRFQLIPNVEPRFSGEGFTVAKIVPPREQSQQVIGDVGYSVLSFKTAITAVKSGELEIPAVSFPVIVEMPSDAPGGFEDMFSQFFGGRMPGFMERNEYEVTSEPFTIDVKSLPREGRPDGFAGAIGEFTIAASAEPHEAGPGDPVTLSLAISGQGNFDSLTEPKLVDADGWRVYPPTERFEGQDQVGFAGTKTFDQPIVAETEQTKTPAAEFSFFDPAQEKYVTLRADPVAVQAAASVDGPSALAAPAVEAEETPATATATPESGTGWIVKTRVRSFEALLVKPAFWIANGVAAAIAGLVVAVTLARRAQSGPAAQRKALVQRRNQLLRALDGCPDGEFHVRAVEVMDVQAQLAGTSGAVDWLRRGASGASSETRRELEGVVGRADEAKFAGGIAVAVAPDERRRTVQALREACK